MNNIPSEISLQDEGEHNSDATHTRRVLVLPAGTEIGLEINAALADCRSIELFAGGEDIPSHARFAFSNYHVIPNVHDESWLSVLDETCKRLAIDYIFPAHDDVVVALSEARERISATIITSEKDTCSTTRSKSATYNRLAHSVRVPQIFSDQESVVSFPVFVKPDIGQGSIGAKRIDDKRHLQQEMDRSQGLIICEYLPGEEFTVDCFSTKDAGVIFSGARRRMRMRNGISVNTEQVELFEAKAMAQKISEKLPLRGAWFFQAKRSSEGDLVLLEVAPRIAGAMATHRVSGINFPYLSILEREDQKIELAINEGPIELDRALHNRYRHNFKYRNLYISLEETLLTGKKVDTDIIKLAFDTRNRGGRVILLANDEPGLHDTLLKHKLSGIFDRIDLVAHDSDRASHIERPGSIYIDNIADQRLRMAKTCKIPTFDKSMIEVLCQQSESISQTTTY